MSKNQLYDIMSRMKNQDQARQILIQNPLLTKALFQEADIVVEDQPRSPILGVSLLHANNKEKVEVGGIGEKGTPQVDSSPLPLVKKCSLLILFVHLERGRNPKSDKEENIYPRVFLSFVLNRPNPQVIVSWNGLVVSSFAKASKILNNEPDVTKFNFPVAGTDPQEYMEVAKRSLVFIKENLYDSQSRRLQHSFRKGPSKAPGILDDLAS
ncbi:unnamed protein product [Lactuca saligna]|uniref:Uncharacterized protein n=1 Tax=Lactuca saligna TaxID=75948 RepID=A0AA35ZS03_LACSI|nr:unnamed protein product [Lactuca saligna]